MSEHWPISWVWWITTIDVPVMAGLFWLIHNAKRESDHALVRLHSEVQRNVNLVLENLAQSKLEVARLYATITDVRDVEKRLSDHLIRIETRLTDLLSSRHQGERSPCAPAPARNYRGGGHD